VGLRLGVKSLSLSDDGRLVATAGIGRNEVRVFELPVAAGDRHG
jgi:hypothetical protein